MSCYHQIQIPLLLRELQERECRQTSRRLLEPGRVCYQTVPHPQEPEHRKEQYHQELALERYQNHQERARGPIQRNCRLEQLWVHRTDYRREMEREHQVNCLLELLPEFRRDRLQGLVLASCQTHLHYWALQKDLYHRAPVQEAPVQESVLWLACS